MKKLEGKIAFKNVRVFLLYFNEWTASDYILYDNGILLFSISKED
jgi:hypothetical protein